MFAGGRSLESYLKGKIVTSIVEFHSRLVDDPPRSDQIGLLWRRQDSCNLGLRDPTALHLESSVGSKAMLRRRLNPRHDSGSYQFVSLLGCERSIIVLEYSPTRSCTWSQTKYK